MKNQQDDMLSEEDLAKKLFKRRDNCFKAKKKEEGLNYVLVKDVMDDKEVAEILQKNMDISHFKLFIFDNILFVETIEERFFKEDLFETIDTLIELSEELEEDKNSGVNPFMEAIFKEEVNILRKYKEKKKYTM